MPQVVVTVINPKQVGDVLVANECVIVAEIASQVIGLVIGVGVTFLKNERSSANLGFIFSI